LPVAVHGQDEKKEKGTQGPQPKDQASRFIAHAHLLPLKRNPSK
jgi:hypothetical protein